MMQLLKVRFVFFFLTLLWKPLPYEKEYSCLNFLKPEYPLREHFCLFILHCHLLIVGLLLILVLTHILAMIVRMMVFPKISVS